MVERFKRMITLYLVRHGQTKENLERIFQGHLPGTLTEEGIEQAKQLREELKDIRFDSIICSDLQRAVDTVDILLDGEEVEYYRTELLREVNWGSWTGMLIKDVDIKNLPSDVETQEMLYERAGDFVKYLKKNYDGTILAVGHGLINRAIQANIQDIPLSNIRTIERVNNCEVRKFIIR